MGGTGDTEDPPDEHRAPRHGSLIHRGQRPRTVPDRRGPLGGRPDEEARLVDEVNDREVEGVSEIDEPGDLLGRVRGPGPAVLIGV